MKYTDQEGKTPAKPGLRITSKKAIAVLHSIYFLYGAVPDLMLTCIVFVHDA
jgi:hypothetical protein